MISWYSFHPSDKCDTRNDHSGEPVIVRDEKIGAGGSGAGELDSVRRSNPLTAANVGIPFRGFYFKWDQFDGSIGKKVEITLPEDRIARLLGLGKRLSESKAAG